MLEATAIASQSAPPCACKPPSRTQRDAPRPCGACVRVPVRPWGVTCPSNCRIVRLGQGREAGPYEGETYQAEGDDSSHGECRRECTTEKDTQQ